VTCKAHQECVGRVRLLLLAELAVILGLSVPSVPTAFLQEALEHGVAAAGRHADAQLTVLLRLLLLLLLLLLL
jgi:hypothetical protein